MLLIISLVVFGVSFALLIAVYNLFMADKQAINSRLELYVERRLLTPPQQTKGPTSTPNLGGIRAVIRSISKYVELPRVTRWLEHRLIQAGLPMRGSEFLVICGGVAIFVAALLGLLTGNPLTGLGGGLVSFFIPLLILRIKIERRTKEFNNQLGDTLVLIANALRTGYSFMQAVEMVSREMPQPISEEFARVLKEMNLGVSTEDALNNLAKRVDSDDLDLVVTAVLIQRQVGGNLAEVLDNIAGTIRERVKIKGKIKTLTAQGRVSGIIVSLLPIGVGVLIYIINPEYMHVLFIHPMGKAMLFAGVFSQLVGIVIIRKIVNIEM